MSKIYSQQDYQGVIDDNYRNYVYNQLRAQVHNGLFNSLKNQKILVAGCGWGYGVKSLQDLGFNDVWGFDASSFAISQGASIVPNRILLGDCTIRSNMNSVRSLAGLQGNQRFRVTITEDLLPCAEDESEAQEMLTELRRLTTEMVHIITPQYSDGTLQSNGSVLTPWGGTQMPGFLWRTLAQWRTIIGAGEPIIDSSTNEVFA